MMSNKKALMAILFVGFILEAQSWSTYKLNAAWNSTKHYNKADQFDIDNCELCFRVTSEAQTLMKNGEQADIKALFGKLCSKLVPIESNCLLEIKTHINTKAQIETVCSKLFVDCRLPEKSTTELASSSLSTMIITQSRLVQRGSSRTEQANRLFNQFKDDLETFERSLSFKQPDLFVEDFFKAVIDEVNDHENQTVAEIQKRAGKMREQLEKMLLERKQNIKLVQRVDLNGLKAKTMMEWEKKMKNPKEFMGLMNEMNENKIDLVRKIDKYENDLLMNTTLHFTPIDGKLFGNLTVNRSLDFDDGSYEGEVLDDLPHGKGEYHFDNGDKYSGEFLNGLRHGKGTQIWANGDRYVGDWREGGQTGHGEIDWHDGNRYVGQVANGLKHGKGTFYAEDGKTFEGDWIEDKMVEA